MCGEKLFGRVSTCTQPGSPPHMRGKGWFFCQSANRPGITPAYAGKRRLRKRRSRRSTDHPRVCGEKEAKTSKPHSVWGSPPRMRGKGRKRSWFTGKRRITPAYAGKRPPWAASGCGYGDHPRTCGEKHQQPKAATAGIGSPPHVRGKGFKRVLPEQRKGITPRMCGEKGIILTDNSPNEGSPPHVRGKACGAGLDVRAPGITPAYAGKSRGD